MASAILATNPTSKKCRRCEALKSIDQFERRPDARSGYRATCKACRRDTKNNTNQRYYHAHRDQELAKAAEYRQRHADQKRRADMRYHWLNRERRNASSRAYYRANRERLIADAMARRQRFRSLDFGWSKDLAHDRIPFDLWQQQQSAAKRQEYVEQLLEHLSDSERIWCEQFLQEETPIPDSILASIRIRLGG